MFANRRALRHLATGLLICGAQACGQSKIETASGSGEVPAGSEGFEQTSFALIGTNCTVNNLATGTNPQSVTFTLATNDSLYMFKRAADGVVVANAPSTADPSECTFPTTYRVIVNSAVSSTTHKVLFDFVGGTFGMATTLSTATSAVNNGPNLVVNLLGSGNTVKIRGTSNWDTFTFGSVTVASTTTSYGSINVGTATAVGAARTFPDLSMIGVNNVVVAAGPGNDMITAQGGTPIAATGSNPLDGAIGFDVYGGDGNDTIISGAASSNGASNNLYGNAGDDMFIQQLVKAKDNISGSDPGTADNDTVDYSLRANALSITLGDDLHACPTSNGRVTCASKTATADNDTFSINDGTTTKTFEYNKTPLTPSMGLITTGLPSAYADFDTLTLDDGVNPAITFEYAVSAASGTLTLATSTDTWIDISAATTAHDVAVATYNAVHAATGATFTITSVAPSSTGAAITLANPAGYNSSIVSSTGNTVSGMLGGFHFVKTSASDIVIDITTYPAGASAAAVCTATAAAITANVGLLGVTAVQALTTDTFVSIVPTVGVSSLGFKPAGAVITKVTGTTLAVTDFTAGTACGSNDGETGEGDTLNADIENVIGGNGNDTIDAKYSTLTTHILVGMLGNDTLIGSNLVDSLWGGVGDDILKGGGGVDALNGGDGNDTLQGGLGNDAIDGGGLNCTVVPLVQPTSPLPGLTQTTSCTTGAAAKSVVAGVNPGINTLDYADRTLPVIVDLSALATATQIGQASEKDVIALVGLAGSAASVQYLRGGAGADTLSGDALANLIWGGTGDDAINGNGGNDALYGEAGDDTIHGDNGGALPSGNIAGDDFIVGGPGTNHLFGDAGNDFIDDLAATGQSSIDCGGGDSDVAMTILSPTMFCEQ